MHEAAHAPCCLSNAPRRLPTARRRARSTTASSPRSAARRSPARGRRPRRPLARRPACGTSTCTSPSGRSPQQRLDCLGSGIRGARAAVARRRAIASTPSGRGPFVGCGFRDGLWPDAPTRRAARRGVGDASRSCSSAATCTACWLNTRGARAVRSRGPPTGLLREDDAFDVTRHARRGRPTTCSTRGRVTRGTPPQPRGVVGIVDLEMDWNLDAWARRIARRATTRCASSSASTRSTSTGRSTRGLRTGERIDDAAHGRPLQGAHRRLAQHPHRVLLRRLPGSSTASAAACSRCRPTSSSRSCARRVAAGIVARRARDRRPRELARARRLRGGRRAAAASSTPSSSPTATSPRFAALGVDGERAARARDGRPRCRRPLLGGPHRPRLRAAQSCSTPGATLRARLGRARVARSTRGSRWRRPSAARATGGSRGIRSSASRSARRSRHRRARRSRSVSPPTSS